jgi:hypothetical protein
VRVPLIRRFSVPATTTHSAGCEVEPSIMQGRYYIEFPSFEFNGHLRGRRLTYSGRLPGFRGRAGSFPLGSEADAGHLIAPRIEATLNLP